MSLGEELVNSMWFDESVVYQIYPLGFCGAPLQNDGVAAERLLKVKDWVTHIKALGATCVLFNPLFESDAPPSSLVDLATPVP